MNEKIAMGFHTCVDYELLWNTSIVEEQIKRFDIHDKELKLDIDILSERDIWIVSLAHLKEGIGCEVIPKTEMQSKEFAKHFEYKITLGGTSTRAAIAISRLGYPSLIQTSCYNEYVRKLLPNCVRAIPGVKDKEIVYPHIVLQCAGGVRVKANDIDFTTPRENRILISYDEDSLNLAVLEDEFGNEIRGCEAFLLGSFTEILDFEILKDRIKKTYNILSYLSDKAVVVMEDGCYTKEEFRKYIHNSLSDRIDILSMNEDELQKY
ncbi:MAG: ADP-dependent glucokinase/phosphofructokinase, partial [Lachnoanaerobaculum saburreum]